MEKKWWGAKEDTHRKTGYEQISASHQKIILGKKKKRKIYLNWIRNNNLNLSPRACKHIKQSTATQPEGFLHDSWGWCYQRLHAN
jgi:hypothetical protein